MKVSDKLSKAKRATQLVFLICGLGLSSWAPMVPFVKDRLLLNEADLGLLLLPLGLGAIIMMPLSGILMDKVGSRKVIAAATLLVALVIPLLLIIPSYGGMAIALFLFGSGLGVVDVAMNTHGVQVQNLYGRPIMSSLHGLFSVGGLLGSLGLGFLIKIGLNPWYAALVIASLLILLLISQYTHLFDYHFEKETIEKFTHVKRESTAKKQVHWLNPGILTLGFMCFSVFLSEGAMLDWSAVFLRDLKKVSAEFTGIGYACFSIAMAIMRLAGDKIIARLNNKIVVVGGSMIAVLGLLLVVISSWLPLVLFGFVLLGIGASNIVPIFFSEAGRIPSVSPTAGLSAVTTLGYAGQLAGPVLLGFIAQEFSLETAFGTIAVLMLGVAGIYGFRSYKFRIHDFRVLK